MGRGKDLTEDEKDVVNQMFEDGMSTLEISKELQRDHRTIKRFLTENGKKRKRQDRGKLRLITPFMMELIIETVKNKPSYSSAEIFNEAGINGISRGSRCRILKTICKRIKPVDQEKQDEAELVSTLLSLSSSPIVKLESEESNKDSANENEKNN